MRDNNPHFLPPQLPEQPEPPRPGPTFYPPPSDHRPGTSAAAPPPSDHRPGTSAAPPPLPANFVPRTKPPEDDYIDLTPPPPPQRHKAPPPRRGGGSGQAPHHHHPHLRVPSRTKTNPLAWLIAACCTLFWILVIFALLAILVIYLVFRPRNPKFDISSATLNAAYLDMGYLLNADLTLLANFTNPNKKGKVEFHYAVVDLYHDKSPIASTYIQQFSMMNHEYKFQDVHLVTSQVGLSADHSQKLRTQIENGKVRFEVKGLFRVRSDLGGILKYSYWLYSHCTIMVSSPPTGILIAKRCSTKR
ncbi:NDR1/HIN1-like protein 13 [Ipomoea triloba]|uniref:NDR1/HIN1-like protein 13 n=1 Tax=Ipomoea triloba TaxID=35885 RepID=UPI00125D2AB1|nr:NDR1/HIN1-like protein 13 [Ipomoea triloba]